MRIKCFKKLNYISHINVITLRKYSRNIGFSEYLFY